MIHRMGQQDVGCALHPGTHLIPDHANAMSASDIRAQRPTQTSVVDLLAV